MPLDEAQLSHLLEGRLRMRVPARRHDAAFFADVAKRLRECEGIEGVRVNPVTGSVLVVHATTPQAIAAFAAQQELFSLHLEHGSSDKIGPSRSRVVVRHGPSRTEQGEEGSRSDKHARMLSATFAGLGTLQTFRGQVMAPALTLFYYAYDAWRSRPSLRGRK
jgi:Heavy metal associated domain 2